MATALTLPGHLTPMAVTWQILRRQPEHKVFADGRQPTILYQTHLCGRKAPNDSPPLNQPGFFGPSLPTPRWGVLALVSAGP